MNGNVVHEISEQQMEGLAGKNTFSDVYVTNPPAGKKTNDVLFSTGLSLSFTH
jgi:hypothetical protein